MYSFPLFTGYCGHIWAIWPSAACCEEGTESDIISSVFEGVFRDWSAQVQTSTVESIQVQRHVRCGVYILQVCLVRLLSWMFWCCSCCSDSSENEAVRIEVWKRNRVGPSCIGVLSFDTTRLSLLFVDINVIHYFAWLTHTCRQSGWYPLGNPGNPPRQSYRVKDITSETWFRSNHFFPTNFEPFLEC